MMATRSKSSDTLPPRSRTQSRTQINEEHVMISDFCNAFWSEGGYQALLGRVKASSKALEDLRALFKERASIEEEYSKKLSKLAKQSLGRDENGALKDAFDRVRSEIESSAKGHGELAQVIRASHEARVREFESQREGRKRQPQGAIEKAWKGRGDKEAFVNKSMEKYRNDCITINGYSARMSLIQGKDLDKVTAKLDKAQQTVHLNESEYKQYSKVLKDATAKWVSDWRDFCDLCQDLEEERIDFTRMALWDFVDSISLMCVKDDNACENIRVALESFDTPTEITATITAIGTGNHISEPPSFIDFSKGESQPSVMPYQVANFPHTSAKLDIRPFEGLAMLENLMKARDQSQPPPSAGPSQPVTPIDPTPAPKLAHKQSSYSSIAPSVLSAPRASQQQPSQPPSPVKKASTPAAALQAAFGGGPTPPSIFSVPKATPPASPTKRVEPATLDSPYRDPTPAAKHMSSGPVDRPPSRGSSLRPASEVTPAPHSAPVSAIAPPAAGPNGEIDPLEAALAKLLTPVPTPGPSSAPPASNVSRNGTNSSAYSQSRPQSRAGDSRYDASRSRPTSPAPSHSRPPSRGPPVHDQRPPSRGPDQRPPSMYDQRPPSRGPTSYDQRPPSRGAQYETPGASSMARKRSQGFAGVGAARATTPDLHRGHSPTPHHAQSPAPYHSQSPVPRPAGYSNSPAQYQQQQSYTPQQQQQQPYPNRPPSQYGPGSNQYGTPMSHSPAPGPSHSRTESANRKSAGYRHGQAMQAAAAANSPVSRPQTTAPYNQPPHPYASPPPQQQIRHSQQPGMTNSMSVPPQSYNHPQNYGPQPTGPLNRSTSAYQPPPQQYQQPPSSHSNQTINRGYSQHNMHSASQASLAGPPPRQQSMQSMQPPPPHQPAYNRAPSPQPQHRAPSPQPPSQRPAGAQYTSSGAKIQMYVRALYDYSAETASDLSFTKDDVIAVIATDEDGWWTGELLDPARAHLGAKTFPSNFVTLLE